MQEGPKGSAAHVAAATAKVDGDFIRANAATTRDWPSYGLDYGITTIQGVSRLVWDNLGAGLSASSDTTRG